VADYFATFDTIVQSAQDADLGSGGALVLPDLADASGTMRHLALGAGKDSKIYVVNRDAMGKFNTSANLIWQEVDGQLPGGVFGMPAYYNNVVYFGAVGDTLKAFPLSAARLATTPSSHSPGTFPYPGATPSISASGATNGIVWAAENGATGGLHSFDAGDLGGELYDSTRSGAGDAFAAGNKFITPTTAHGHVLSARRMASRYLDCCTETRGIAVGEPGFRITAPGEPSATRIRCKGSHGRAQSARRLVEPRRLRECRRCWTPNRRGREARSDPLPSHQQGYRARREMPWKEC
jgi:hypothetical protein